MVPRFVQADLGGLLSFDEHAGTDYPWLQRIIRDGSNDTSSITTHLSVESGDERDGGEEELPEGRVRVEEEDALQVQRRVLP